MEEKKLDLEELKKQDSQYIFELQKFMDIVSNVENEDLKEQVVYQRAKCENRLKQILEEKLF